MKIFYLPDLGEGLAEAEIREWYVREGETVKVDQPLVSMETAKAVVDVPSPYAGKIVKLHGQANDIIPTGAPFISFEIEGAQVKEPDKGSVVGKLETSEKNWDDGAVIVGSGKKSSNSIKAMPAARLLAKEMNVDLALFKGSGPQGLITPGDVKAFLQKNSTPTSNPLDQAEDLHGVRRMMAQVMTQSHAEVVPVTIIEDADITDLSLQTDITARLLKAMVSASQVEPALNAWFDGAQLKRKVFKEVHIGLAVDTEEGLFVPVIKNVENQSVEKLRETINHFKKSIRDRTVSPKDLQGATMTLSNFGMIAGRYATPIIVPPAVAILGCGRSREVALVREGKIMIGRTMPLSLTFDHRAVTGGEATRFLRALINHLVVTD